MLTPEELRDISELVEPGANIAFARKYTPEQRWRMANDLQTMADALPQNIVKFGCHIDLSEGEEPDGCVIDEGRFDDCVYAKKFGPYARKHCGEWKPIVFSKDQSC